MSKASTRKRNKITLALGAFTMITFGGVYGMIAHNATVGQSAAVAAVAATSDAQTTALVLINAPTAVSTVAPTPAPLAAAAAVAATPAPTAAPTPQPTAAPIHTNTRAS